ncbi:COMM domain-containing protein 3 isoform X1 [Acyrthosiphon pisum]|uniref:COMM domain-containing protein 3 n=1 Tax=Acyrthosiphon pisum TaxID=7029 RepID=C4WU56_ACYPI|nr:COMM domain-containing protein 3 [Acyrthosiphon pisum]XP_008180830.1 COMM domain-containing protein 3 isoform X1 [Acyrthosiphon pisum]XP_008180831.1 COMM domain-containing protein 3 isoform X1 [Acyrthosiphon pisum]XP_008180832.1 COMM domain-containing protein 3 isoform X1 [Acyrthosiphon pisum]BAH71426.1 ACYPI009243 [Acyrthosiphon pisum]|eukprot:NP_001155791.1 COMM domain-containing protein 3 [Acyrthosiphon pisum]
MNISTEIELGLKRLCNPALINDKCFQTLLQKAEKILGTLLDDTSEQTFDNDSTVCITSKQDIAKEAYASLITLFIIANRHCLDGKSLNQNLQTIVLANTDRLSEIIKTYESVRPRLLEVSKITTTSLANVVDVECRLDYCVQSSVFDDVSEFLYKVRLKTIDNGTIKFIDFVCNIQELQELVFKLKDAVRHLEKIASAS